MLQGDWTSFRAPQLILTHIFKPTTDHNYFAAAENRLRELLTTSELEPSGDQATACIWYVDET